MPRGLTSGNAPPRSPASPRRRAAGSAGREELSGSTITITSLGRARAASWPRPSSTRRRSPSSASTGSWSGRWCGTAAVVRGKVMNLSCSFDHRVVDGWDAAAFIQAVKAVLEQPALLFVEPPGTRSGLNTRAFAGGHRRDRLRECMGQRAIEPELRVGDEVGSLDGSDHYRRGLDAWFVTGGFSEGRAAHGCAQRAHHLRRRRAGRLGVARALAPGCAAAVPGGSAPGWRLPPARTRWALYLLTIAVPVPGLLTPLGAHGRGHAARRLEQFPRRFAVPAAD